MINTLRNMVSNVFYAPVSQTSAVGSKVDYGSGNPFVQAQNKSGCYGINKPVKGGYFAGYYNGKPNTVGRKLFIEA